MNGVTSNLCERVASLFRHLIHQISETHAQSYHKYDVIDYTTVDPELGTEEDFRLLCAKAHELGMYVV